MKLHFLALLALAAGAQAQAQTISLPGKLSGVAQVLSPTDPDYARAVVTSAVKPAGMGGVSEAIVIRVTQDINVYRMWNGPTKIDARGNTNRMGGWWAYDAPQGTVNDYRSNYEICQGWNDLAWVAKCTLKAGAVVAIGPGQSVSAETCGDPTGKEQFPANGRDWQLYVDKPWARAAELACPADTADYQADPANIAVAKAQ